MIDDIIIPEESPRIRELSQQLTPEKNYAMFMYVVPKDFLEKSNVDYWRNLFVKHISAGKIYEDEPKMYQSEYLEYSGVNCLENGKKTKKIHEIVEKNYEVIFANIITSKNNSNITLLRQNYSNLFLRAYLSDSEEILELLVSNLNQLTEEEKVRTIKNCCMDAIFLGDVDMLSYFTNLGYDIDNDEEAMLNAVKSNSIEICEYLRAYGINFRMCADSALTEAARKSSYEMVNYLLSLGCVATSNHNRAIYHAAHRGDLRIFSLLTERDYSVNVSNILEGAVRGGNRDIIRLVMNKKPDAKLDDSSALTVAVETAMIDIVEKLVYMGANLKANPDLIVHAAISGDLVMFNYLVTKGLDPFFDEQTPLIEAVTAGCYNIVQYLVEIGADVTIDDNICLKRAMSAADLKMVDILCELPKKYNYKAAKYEGNPLKLSNEELRDYFSKSALSEHCLDKLACESMIHCADSKISPEINKKEKK